MSNTSPATGMDPSAVSKTRFQTIPTEAETGNFSRQAVTSACRPAAPGGYIASNRHEAEDGIEAEIHAHHAEPGIEQAGDGIQCRQFLADGAPIGQHHGADFLVCRFSGHSCVSASPDELAAIASARKAC